MNFSCVRVAYLEQHLRIANETAPAQQLLEAAEWIAGALPQLQQGFNTDPAAAVIVHADAFEVSAKKITDKSPDQFSLAGEAVDLNVALDHLHQTLILAGDPDYPPPPKFLEAGAIRSF